MPLAGSSWQACVSTRARRHRCARIGGGVAVASLVVVAMTATVAAQSILQDLLGIESPAVRIGQPTQAEGGPAVPGAAGAGPPRAAPATPGAASPGATTGATPGTPAPPGAAPAPT